MKNYLFTSESAGIGHPDKICDQIADAILDACLEQDPFSRVACEAMITTGILIIAGEISTKAQVDFQEVAREILREIGYSDCRLGFDYRSCGVILMLNKQSEDIARGIFQEDQQTENLGAGDQGIMFGYACDETPELMPLPIMLAHRLTRRLKQLREEKVLSYLRPDGKSQVTIEYDHQQQPIRIHTVVLSAQHDEEVHYETLLQDLKKMIIETLPERLLDDKTKFFINPTGRFVIGGPVGDCGLTGRKVIIDTYGGMGRHGGGAFSGKDPTKVDRSGAYGARYVAKNIVAAGFAKRCEVQIAYGIGIKHPLSIKVDTFGTSTLEEEKIMEAVFRHFDLSPAGLITMLSLRRPIYRATSFGGHFGRDEETFTWEKTDKIIDLQKGM